MNNGYQQFFKKAQSVASEKKLGSNSQKPLASAIKKKTVDSKTEAENFKNKIRLSYKNKMSKKKKIPWTMINLSFLGVIVAIIGLQYSGEIERYLKKIEISMGVASAEEVKGDEVKTQDSAKEKATNTEKASGSAAEEPKTSKSEQSDFTDEEINHFSKLNDRKKELDAREEELNRMEAEFTKQKEDLEKRLKELENTRRQISSVLEEKVQGDEKKVDTLVQVYTNMKPQQAAKVFESMDEDLAIDILSKMKKKPAAEILNLVKAEKAQILSEKFAGYKRK